MSFQRWLRLGTLIGDSTSPLVFGWLIQSGSAVWVSAGYVFAALSLHLTAVTEFKFEINAEGKSLQIIAIPPTKQQIPLSRKFHIDNESI